MAKNQNPPPLPVSDRWKEVAACVDRYEEAAASELPGLSTVLEGVAPANRLDALVELVLVDAEHRRVRGQEKPLADYLQEFPELASRTDLQDRLLRSGSDQPPESAGGSAAQSPAKELFTTTLPFRVSETDKLPSAPSSHPGGGEAEGPAVDQPAIGKYVIVGELGSGGFGTVYRCQDLDLHRDVAVKVAHELSSSGLDCREAFRHEARNAAKLRHPNIVAVLAFGETEDHSPYIVYEYVAGTTLSERIQQKDYTLQQGVQWIAEIADALNEAHKHKIVHRDIKPANILIDEKGNPRLTDFGLARRDDLFFIDDQGARTGTPLYFSPEQAGNRPDWASPAADIYSLGVVLYKVLCGRVPFRSDRMEELLEQIKHREPDSPRTINDEIPVAVDEVCLKALSKDPVNRYRTAKDMGQALCAAIRPRKSWLPLAGIAAAIVSLLAAVIWNMKGDGKPAEPLAVTKLGVYVVPAGSNQEYRLGVPEKGPPHSGDSFGFHGELCREAYWYVALFDGGNRPTLLWPSESDLDHPQKKRSLEFNEFEQTALALPAGDGVTLLLCGASDKPLSRRDLDELRTLKPPFPPPVWDGKLHTWIKPAHEERADEDIRGGGISLPRAAPFKVPDEVKDAADRRFAAYYAIMFAHFARDQASQAQAAKAKP